MQTILIVDDDGFSRGLLADTVRALGHRVTVAVDAREALQFATTSPHDGVITDVRMPGWDGIELARRIALLPDAPPVVLMSADPDFDIHEEALRRGVRPASFLQKPFDRISVARAISILTEGDNTAPTGGPRPDLASVPIARDELPEWLARVRGRVQELPPARVWYVAWRRQATGAIVVRQGLQATVVGLRRGQIVDVSGMPGLLTASQPAGMVADSLTAAIGGALSIGHPLEQTLAAVASDVARWMTSVRSGEVRFNPDWKPGADGIPLPGSPPQLLVSALAELPSDALQKAWQSVGGARVNPRSPTDVPPERWGIDPYTLRAHRLATGQAVQAMVYELSGGAADKRIQALRALDLLLRLNLIALGA